MNFQHLERTHKVTIDDIKYDLKVAWILHIDKHSGEDADGNRGTVNIESTDYKLKSIKRNGKYIQLDDMDEILEEALIYLCEKGLVLEEK